MQSPPLEGGRGGYVIPKNIHTEHVFLDEEVEIERSGFSTMLERY